MHFFYDTIRMITLEGNYFMFNFVKSTQHYFASILFASLLFGIPSNLLAIDTSIEEFKRVEAMNTVISDDDFVSINSMTEAQIQEFLVSYESYLKDYKEGDKLASRIIYEAAHGLYDAAIGTAKGVTISKETGTVNPRVILVYLQKEQGLLTKTEYDEYALKFAMGYDCPDATGCTGSRHPGFSEQVGWGAWQLRYNYEIAKKDKAWWDENYPLNPIHSDPTDPEYRHFYVGLTRTFYDWTGSYSVKLNNAATASIYRYTPHVFDSSYNVWQFYNKWTWPTPPAGGAAPPPPPPPPKPVKPGDINNDDAVDILDLSIFSNTWGAVEEENKSDLNNNGTVDIEDLSILASNWGK